MDFANSKSDVGLQIADICANICYRFSSRNPKYRAYRLLRSRILGPTGGRGRGGSKLILLVLDKDSLGVCPTENGSDGNLREEFFGARDEHSISSVLSRTKLSAATIAVGLAGGR